MSREREVELFDAHLHPAGLRDEDLDTLRLFGVTGALLFPTLATATAKGLLRAFDALLENDLPRVRRAGIRGVAAVGIHPVAIPKRGLSEVLAALPNYLGHRHVVALGESGFHQGDALEQDALLEQLALSRRLRLPIVLHTPEQHHDMLTRQMLRTLRETRTPTTSALLDHLRPTTVRLVLAQGHYAGLTVHPEGLRVERAVNLIRQLGAQRIVVNSDGGAGASELLGPARLEGQLQKARVAKAVRGRVTSANAQVFLRL
ncbi:MAG: TatD family hydrolase [Myxococcaceae bacterium]